MLKILDSALQHRVGEWSLPVLLKASDTKWPFFRMRTLAGVAQLH